MCIKGGPITNLEQHEMNLIANEVERELDEIKLDATITLQYVSYGKFCREFP